MVCEFMEAQDLQDVTLVGNDSGGGICQLLVTSEHPAAGRVGRLVLTNEVPGANLLLPLDAPARVAAEIAAFVRGDDQCPIASPP